MCKYAYRNSRLLINTRLIMLISNSAGFIGVLPLNRTWNLRQRESRWFHVPLKQGIITDYIIRGVTSRLRQPPEPISRCFFYNVSDPDITLQLLGYYNYERVLSYYVKIVAAGIKLSNHRFPPMGNFNLWNCSPSEGTRHKTCPRLRYSIITAFLVL